MFDFFPPPPTLPPAEANHYRSGPSDVFMKYVGRLMTEVERQQKANRIKKRKLRALRKALRVYRDLK